MEKKIICVQARWGKGVERLLWLVIGVGLCQTKDGITSVKAVNSGISVITFLKVVKFNTRFLGSRSPSITRKKVNTKSDLRVRISDEEEGEEG